MNWKQATMIALLTFSLASCAKPGDFCDLYQPFTLGEDVARAVVDDDRADAEAMATNRLTWLERCVR